MISFPSKLYNIEKSSHFNLWTPPLPVLGFSLLFLSRNGNWLVWQLSKHSIQSLHEKEFNDIFKMYEGDVLLKKWKQGYTLFGIAIKDPINRVFLCKFFASIHFRVSSPVIPINTKNLMMYKISDCLNISCLVLELPK